jgi:guanylate kinase
LSKRLPSVIVVSAPSGAGKTTILSRVLREMPGIRFSVSHTTRPPRAGEQDGVDYHFVDDAEFAKLEQQSTFLESASVYGHCYGTSRREYDLAQQEGVDLLLDLDVQGAAQVRAKMPDAVSIFILPPSYQDLEGRLRGRRQDGEESIRRRLREAGQELGHYGAYDYALVNDDLDRSVEELKSVIRAARLRVSRVADEAREILKTFESNKER